MQLKKIKTVIIEDELAAREALKSYLNKYCPQIEVINEVKPELVFLDVEMPYGNAFDVLEGCKENNFETIFVTAFSEYSLKALNMSAAYYLLKPVSIEELILAVTKVQQQLQNKEWINRNKIILDNHKTKKPDAQQIILPTLEGFEVAKVSDIIRLKGNGNFTDIYFNDSSKKMVCRFLKHFDELLEKPFLRVHKSHIININSVKSYNKGGFATLTDGAEIEISATYKSAFLEAFQG